MKKSVGSFIALNHKILLLFGIMLALAAVGFMGLGATRENVELASGDVDPDSQTEPVREDDPNGRADWFMYQRMYPFDKVPDGARRLHSKRSLGAVRALDPLVPGRRGPGSDLFRPPRHFRLTEVLRQAASMRLLYRPQILRSCLSARRQAASGAQPTGGLLSHRFQTVRRI